MQSKYGSLTPALAHHHHHHHMQTIDHHHMLPLGDHMQITLTAQAQARAQAQEATKMASLTYRSAFASAPFTPAADYATPLEALITPHLPYCAHCLRHIPARDQADRSIVPGTVVYLPTETSIPADSIIRHQPAVNSGAYAHPGLALLTSRCGHLVFVAPVTSFDGAGIVAKYNSIGAAAKENIFWRYLALQSHLPAHNDLRALELVGDDLPKASYVHLDHGYWVERGYLTVQGAHSRKRTAVSGQALGYARWAYGVAEGLRRKKGITCSQVVSPQSPSTSLVVPVAEGFGQGALWREQSSARPFSVGKDAGSWRSGGNLGRASWRDTPTSHKAVPYAVGKSQASWRRGS